jgi:predicted lipid-binding transport protein (Tim44 family)
MSESLFQEFSKVIADSEASDSKTETTLVSVVAKDITKATMTQNTAQLTVLFVSEQVSVVRNKNGDIIGGDASHINHAEDYWVFERDVASKNPNWKIIEN